VKFLSYLIVTDNAKQYGKGLAVKAPEGGRRGTTASESPRDATCTRVAYAPTMAIHYVNAKSLFAFNPRILARTAFGA
jgi:hypothetical protein